MSTTALPSPPRPATGRARVRAFVAAHPVASAVTIMLVVGWSLMVPAALAGLPIEPFLLGTVLIGQLGGGVLVTATTGGRPAVKDLFSRTFRWRVRPQWWPVALLGVAVPSLLLASAVFGPGALLALVGDPSVITGWLTALTILPLVNLWEELSWTGVIQSRLMARHGLLLGSVLTAPWFVLIHLPLQLGHSLRAAALGVAGLAVVAVPFRIVVGWLYQRTGSSVLLVAVFHAAFNATNNGSLLVAASPAHEGLLRITPWVVVGLWALGVAHRQTRLRTKRTGCPGQRAAR